MESRWARGQANSEYSLLELKCLELFFEWNVHFLLFWRWRRSQQRNSIHNLFASRAPVNCKVLSSWENRSPHEYMSMPLECELFHCEDGKNEFRCWFDVVTGETLPHHCTHATTVLNSFTKFRLSGISHVPSNYDIFVVSAAHKLGFDCLHLIARKKKKKNYYRFDSRDGRKFGGAWKQQRKFCWSFLISLPIFVVLILAVFRQSLESIIYYWLRSVHSYNWGPLWPCPMHRFRIFQLNIRLFVFFLGIFTYKLDSHTQNGTFGSFIRVSDFVILFTHIHMAETRIKLKWPQ